MNESPKPPRATAVPNPEADWEHDPQLAGLLDFEPAPRKVNRPDGWNADRQRTFIRLIVETGSPQRAAAAMGKKLCGVEEVYRGEGAEDFRAAWDRAVALVEAREKRRLARLGERDVPEPPHRREASPLPQEGGPTPAASQCEPASPPVTPAHEDLLRALFKKFILKIRAERTARLAGRIAEADFYLRQIAFFEVAIELASEDAVDAFDQLRRGDFHIIDIAQTRTTEMLDRLRRKAWLDLELERIEERKPSPPGGEGDSAQAERGEGCEGEYDDNDPFDLFPRHLLADHGDFRSEPLPGATFAHPAQGHTAEEWAALDQPARKAAYEAQYARAAAEEQATWEAEMLVIARSTEAGCDPWGEQQPLP